MAWRGQAGQGTARQGAARLGAARQGTDWAAVTRRPICTLDLPYTQWYG